MTVCGKTVWMAGGKSLKKPGHSLKWRPKKVARHGAGCKQMIKARGRQTAGMIGSGRLRGAELEGSDGIFVRGMSNPGFGSGRLAADTDSTHGVAHSGPVADTTMEEMQARQQCRGRRLESAARVGRV